MSEFDNERMEDAGDGFSDGDDEARRIVDEAETYLANVQRWRSAAASGCDAGPTLEELESNPGQYDRMRRMERLLQETECELARVHAEFTAGMARLNVWPLPVRRRR